MTDLQHDIRNYVEAAFEAVGPAPAGGLDASSSTVTQTRWLSRRPAIVVGVAALVVIALVVGVASLRSRSETTGLRAGQQAASGPAIPLSAKGNANCSFAKSAISPNAKLVVAATVLDGHTICLSRNPKHHSIRAFFDDEEHSVAVGVSNLATGLNFFGIDGTIRGHPVLVGTLPNAAQQARLTFCDGQTIDVPTLNARQPRAFAVAIDSRRYGTPSIQALDFTGKPIASAGQLTGVDERGEPCRTS